MTTLPRLAAALALTVLVAPAAPALAAPPLLPPAPEGVRCVLASTGDLVQNGTLVGGPLWVGDGAATATCTVQVAAPLHSDPDAALVVATGTGVVAVPLTLVTYLAPPAAPVFLCTQVALAGGTLYWDGVANVWSANPNAPCVSATMVPSPAGWTYAAA